MGRRFRKNKFVTGFVKVTGLPALLILKPKFYYLNEKCSKKLPKPCILVSNHISLVDMPLYWYHYIFDNIRFLVAEVMFNKNAFMNFILFSVGCIHVDRDKYDFSFIGECLDCLDRGESIGIFPSSRLPVNGVPFPFKPSVAIIATHTDAPVIPVYTDGNYGFFKRAHVMVGEPLNVNDFCPDTTLPETQRARIITSELEKYVNNLGEELKARMNKG